METYYENNYIFASFGYKCLKCTSRKDGTYSVAYSKISLGSSVEFAPKTRVFLQLESETVESKISTESGLRLTSIRVNNQTASELSFANAYLTSVLMNTSKMVMELSGFRTGISYTF